jgi:hypothetical protein
MWQMMGSKRRASERCGVLDGGLVPTGSQCYTCRSGRCCRTKIESSGMARAWTGSGFAALPPIFFATQKAIMEGKEIWTLVLFQASCATKTIHFLPRACLDGGVSVSLKQTNTKTKLFIQTHLLVWC